MKIKMFLNIIVVSLILVNEANSQESENSKLPNYNFNLDQLKVFYPGNSLGQLPQGVTGPVELKLKGQSIFKYGLMYNRYKFSVFVNQDGKNSTGFFARLPQYFSHDLFHQALINRYGKQDKYFKKESSAIYQWVNKDGLRIIYRGSCTITCFPLYLVVTKEADVEKNLLKLFDQTDY